MPYNRELNGAMPHYLSSFEQAKTCSHIIWNCFLSSVATDGKDGNGLKLEKVALAQLFSNFNLKCIMVVLPD